MGVATADDGSLIRNGLVRTVYLQCGRPDENAQQGRPQRFYLTAAAWHAMNPPPAVEKPLGPVIHT